MRSDNPLISIIIPCYNQERYIADALDSVLRQTYTNWECIIIDDGSTDSSEKIIQAYLLRDNRFEYVYQNNSGLSAARNAGIKKCNGLFIQLLDSDDLLEPFKVASCLKAYENLGEDEYVIVYSSMRYFEDNAPTEFKILGRGDFVPQVELKNSDDQISQKELLIKRNPCVVSAPLYPSFLFKDFGLFDETLTALEDWDFNIRCALGGCKFHHSYYKYGLTLIRLRDSSMMRNQLLLDINFSKVQAKHGLSQNLPTIRKRSFIKTAIINLLPPIFIKSLLRLKSKPIINSN